MEMYLLYQFLKDVSTIVLPFILFIYQNKCIQTLLIALLKEKSSDKENEISILESKIEDLEDDAANEISILKSKIKALEDKEKNSKDEICYLRSAIEDLEDESIDLKNEADILESKIKAKLEPKFKDLEASIGSCLEGLIFKKEPLDSKVEPENCEIKKSKQDTKNKTNTKNSELSVTHCEKEDLKSDAKNKVNAEPNDKK